MLDDPTLTFPRPARDRDRKPCNDLTARGGAVILRHWTDILAVARSTGADALALAWATRDMVLDPETSPSGWPIAELIELIARKRPASSPVLRDLRGLLQAVDGMIAEAMDEPHLGSAA